jgi:hypothetical protein
MPAFLYRCPNIGLMVQGWAADRPTDQDEGTYETVTCPICARIHLVNSKTASVLGEGDGENRMRAI